MLHLLAEITANGVAAILGGIATLFAAILAAVKLWPERIGQELENVDRELKLAWESADRAKAEEANMRAARDTALDACEVLQARNHELEQRLARLTP